MIVFVNGTSSHPATAQSPGLKEHSPMPTKKATSTKTTTKRKTAASKKTASAKTRTSSKKTKAAKAGDREVTIDRRSSSDRREEASDAIQAEPKAERRTKVQRRRQIDPTTCERDYSTQEVEFMNAMDLYKRTSGRMFPTCSEVLEVIRGLGYVQLTPAEMAIVRPEVQEESNAEEGTMDGEQASAEFGAEEAEFSEEALSM